MEFSLGSAADRIAKAARVVGSGIARAAFLMGEGFDQDKKGEAGLRKAGAATDFDGMRTDGDEIVTPSGMRVPIVAECNLHDDK